MQTRKNKKHKLIIYLNYGLANRMFQILSAMGFAEKWNMDLYISEKYMHDNDHKSVESSINDIKHIFPTIKILDKNYDTSNFLKINKNYDVIDYFKIDINLLKAYDYIIIKNPRNDAILYGQFGNEKFFPKKYVKLNLTEPSNSIIKGYKNLFFIHFRLGDYKELICFMFNLELEKYYKYCIQKILDKYKNANFIILSNDIKSAKKYIKDNKLLDNLTDNTVIYDEKGSRLDSLYYMSQCKGGICANSTFSWMGAYSIKNKNKDLIFMPNKWLDFKIFDIISNYIIETDGIYPNWATRVPLDVKV